MGGGARAVLLPADVIRFEEDGAHFRVALVDPPADRLVLFDIDGDRGFRLAAMGETLDGIDAGRIVQLHEHGFDAPARGGPPSEKRKARGERLMAALAPLLDLGVEVFDDRRRGTEVAKAAQATGLDPKTIHAALDRYFRRGMTEDAVTPGFVGCGGPGKARARGGAKLGRPRIHGGRPGTNMTPELEKMVELGLRRYYARNGRISLAGTRTLILQEFCMERRVDPETGRLTHSATPLYSKEDFLTVRQISYWYAKNLDVFAIKRERTGRKRYDRNLRGVTGTAQSTTTGPGSRYEIDATIINIYVVSETDSGLVVGRPVLYVVVDVFSKMIVGFWIGLEGPSWVGAMMALVNVAEDKKEFCARHGVRIEEEEWPCRFLPEKLLGDRGEIAGRTVEHLQRRHHVTVENAQSHRPDWKASVEKRFDLIDAKYRPFVSGWVAPDWGERGAEDPRIDAVWTISDLVPVMIRIILHFNNRHKLVDYPRDGDMIRHGVRAVPIELWNWGVANRQGRMRRAEPDAVRFSVMPVEEASVRKNGIYFHGMHYTCAKAEGEKWFDKARQDGRWKIPASFDPRSARHIYLHDDGEPCGYIVCDLLPRDEHYADCSFQEVGAIMAADKGDTADRSVEEAEAEADLAAEIQEREARARKRAAGRPRRKPKDLKGIRDNHAAEKAARRQDEAFDLGEHADGEQAGSGELEGERDGNVVQFPSGGAATEPSEEDWSEPDINQMLNPRGR